MEGAGKREEEGGSNEEECMVNISTNEHVCLNGLDLKSTHTHGPQAPHYFYLHYLAMKYCRWEYGLPQAH